MCDEYENDYGEWIWAYKWRGREEDGKGGIVVMGVLMMKVKWVL